MRVPDSGSIVGDSLGMECYEGVFARIRAERVLRELHIRAPDR